MSRRTTIMAFFAALVLAFLTGCTSFVAPHDEVLAAGLTGLQSSNARFFDELQQAAGTPDAAWTAHVAWYEETRTEIAALRVRAALHGAQNGPTVEALDLLQKSVDELEQAHVHGLSPGEIPVLRTLLDVQLRMLIQLETAKKNAVREDVSL